MKKMNKARVYSSATLREAMQKRDPGQTNRARTSMLIASRIGDILQELNWKKKDLAEKLGKQPSEVTKWLSGTHNFTINILTDIETATGKKILNVVEHEAASKVITGQTTVYQRAAKATAAFIPKTGNVRHARGTEVKTAKQHQRYA